MTSSPDDQPTRPTIPGTRPAEKTVITDLSGAEQTRLTDLAAAMTQVGPRPGQDAMTITAATRSDLQDAIPTHLSDAQRKHVGTDLTNLHVGSGPPPASEGTHLGETWGDFQFIRLLGRGGMGAVYLGKQLSLDREVAIKVLPKHLSENEQFRDRFQLEAKAVAKMSSPHVVQVYAAGIHLGHYYFAMEYVEGEDLSRRIRTGQKLGFRQSLDLVVQAAKGLAAAGENGIVHRDIKPGNMMIDRKGSLKIMDFGLVRLASAAQSLTMSGTVMGTVSYFSPEQGRGEPCDQRTDLYALGVVFYELLTGRLPFTGENATSVIYQHIHTPPKQPRELDPAIPEDYQAVVLKCMQKRADDRYTTAQELLGDLERLVAGQPPAVALERPELLRTGATIVGSGAFGPARRVRRSPVGMVAAVAAGVAVVAGGGWFLLRSSPVPASASNPVSMAPTMPAQPIQVDPQITAMLTALAQQQHQDKARRDAIASAETMLAEGRYADAEATLAALSAADPADVPIAAALRKVQIARAQADRPALAPTPNPDPGSAASAAPTTNALANARDALARGDLPEARRVVNVNRGLNSDDPAWAEVARALDTAEGRQALREAQAAFAKGNVEFAGTAAAKAKGLIPDDPDLAKLLSGIEQVEGDRKQRDRALLEADNLLTENQPAKAADMLAGLAQRHPDDAQIANALRRARAAQEKSEALQKAVTEQLAQGVAALARGDLDAAQLAYTAARQLDPKNEAVAQGMNVVRDRKEAIDAARKRVEAAIQANDLATAEAELGALERLAPGTPSAVLAASQVNAAKVVQADQRAKAEALERNRQERARLLATRLDDLTITADVLEPEIAAFAKDAGADRAELPDLRRRLDDRRSRDATIALLHGVQAAFIAKQADGIRTAFAGPADGSQLIDFMAMPGARISIRLTGFVRNGDTGVASVEVVHAMDEVPEERLQSRWELRRSDGAWRIITGRIDSAEGNR